MSFKIVIKLLDKKRKEIRKQKIRIKKAKGKIKERKKERWCGRENERKPEWNEKKRKKANEK